MKLFKNSIVLLFALSLIITITGCSSDNRFIGSPYSDLPVYAEDSENSTMVGTLYKGQKAKVIHENWNDWTKIEFNGGEAYIYGANAELIDENGERIWLSKGLIKGLGIGIGAIVAIGLAFAIIGLIFSGIAFLFGLLMSIIGYVVGFAGIGWILGYFVTHDFESTIRWITGGAILGVIVGIVKIVLNPSAASASGIKSASEAYSDYKRKEANREAEETRRRNEEYPLEIDGVGAKRLADGTILDEKGNKWADDGYGNNVTKIN